MISAGIIHIIVYFEGIVQCAVEFEGRRGTGDCLTGPPPGPVRQKKGSRLSDDRAGGDCRTQEGKKPTRETKKLTGGVWGKWEIIVLPHF